MACDAIHGWTLSSLVGAYLDLALAYLFLCGSTLAYLAAKFLALFSLALPCSCQHGLFSHVSCLQRLLVDRPLASIASVQDSVRSRFPFDSTCPNYDVKFLRPTEDADVGDDDGGRFLNVGHEESCRSVTSLRSDSKLTLPCPDRVEGKRPVLVGHQPGSVLRRRRWRRGKSKSIASSSSTLDWQVEHFSNSPISLNHEHHHRQLVDSRDDRADIVEEEQVESRVSTSDEKVASAGAGDVHVYDVNEANGHAADIIRDLERELEKERAAHAALYVELEKERNAAASAADEAMAMILRLQEEKAAIEMEARQYQRMIEEKSAYDGEEMEILKEIIVRREKEKHFLEKEVEEYHEMLVSGRMEMGEKPECSMGFMRDPELMPHQISESMGKIEETNCEKDQVASGPSGKHDLKQHDLGDEGNLEFQEKGMVAMDLYPSFAQMQRSSLQETSLISNREDNQRHKEIEMRVPFNCQYKENHEDGNQKGGSSSQVETDSIVLDVHVIEDQVESCNGGKGKVGSSSQMGWDLDTSCEGSPKYYESRNIDTSNSLFVSNWEELQENINRSSSDTVRGMQPANVIYDNERPIHLRRILMPAVDIDRFKLETEVEFLRDRLKVVQQGREKLTFSAEHREKENFQLQLLEDIAFQLREIRRVTEPGLSFRHASLPSPSAKVSSKKRRCRSASWGVQ